MNGCNNYAFKKLNSYFDANMKFIVNASCKAGHDGRIKSWYDKFGDTKIKELPEESNMPCFEATQTSKSLDKMNELLDEIGKTIDSK